MTLRLTLSDGPVAPDPDAQAFGRGVLLPGLVEGALSSTYKPSRAIFSRFRLAAPGAGSRYGLVRPRNWRISSDSLTSTPAGAY